MKILVVGGNGFVGGCTALYLRDKGHEVTIMSRSRPMGSSTLNDLPHITGDYVNDDFNNGRLEGFEGLVFCAGTDLGNFPKDGSVTRESFFEACNTIAVPRFFEAARRAGISRAVYMSSFYPMINPDSPDPYVRSRLLADIGARELSTPSFNVCSCGLPWIVGHIPGYPSAQWLPFVKYALGQIPGVEAFAPPGGANFLSALSVAEAMEGGLLRGESGKAYLIGDANLSWKAFFDILFEAAGHPVDLEVRGDDHPLLPKEILDYVGDGSPYYTPPKAETRLLGYRRGVAIDTFRESVDYYKTLCQS